MLEDIINLKNQAIGCISEAVTLSDLQEIETSFLGRNGSLTLLVKEITKLPTEQKKEVGIIINESKKTILEFLHSQKQKIRETTTNSFDATIPGIKKQVGHTHLVTQAINEISKTFENLGFTRARYPGVEWDWYSFEALNMPQNHPARDDWETYFVDFPKDLKYGQMVLTPHTSSGQVREMQRVNPNVTGKPIRMINIAKCYRRQSDISHVPVFHQFEGLVVDHDITITNLKGTLDYFARSFFGPTRKTRLRPYHFQFTEPSFEVDISCGNCDGTGINCKLCKAGWLELGGAGMVHPKVLEYGGVDSKKFTGFAFGWGVERVGIMKSGIKIPDIRILYSPDLRFLRQF